MVEYLLTSLLEIHCRAWWWKNFENWLAFRVVIGKNKVALYFFRHGLYVKVFSTLSGVKLSFWILSQFSILCTRQAKWYYTQNEHSESYVTATFSVLQRTGFHWSRIVSRSSVLCFIRSRTDVFNFTALKYSLHKCNDITLC